MPKTSKIGRNRNGFTLVEILVVVGIIALLAAISLAVFARVKNSARTTSCQSNLRQIGLAMQLYTADARGLYPAYSDVPPNCTWVDALLPYVKSGEIFNCPAAPDEIYKPGCGVSESDGTELRDFNGSYVLNVPDAARTVSTNRVRFPDRFIVVFDGQSSSLQFASPNEGTGLIAPESQPGNFRHDGRLNALFADGHVRKLAAEKVSKRGFWRLNGKD